MSSAVGRRFLFLQGPHGPFFGALARALAATGATCWHVGFNGGDAAFAARGDRFLPYRDDLDRWPEAIRDLLDAHAITDLVLYGGSRPVHRTARDAADAAGVTVHTFEEGYLRPYWITYERGGANAESEATRWSIERMAAALGDSETPLRAAPDRWGDMRAHIFWGAVYHGALLARPGDWPNYRPHRSPDVAREAWLHLRKLFAMPAQRVGRALTTRRVLAGAFPFHVVLMQLAHDANFRDHGPFPNQAAFLETVFRGFARGAPRHHHLVVKSHPLEDGREPLGPLIRHLGTATGLGSRVHFVTGGKLARLLDAAESAVTVNSTSAEQALWRGLPLKAFGDAVYARPEFISPQAVEAFFAAPQPPDRAAYTTYRRFLLATSQIAGGFYSRRGRRRLLRRLPDLMLAPLSPYETLLQTPEAAPQHIRLVT